MALSRLRLASGGPEVSRLVQGFWRAARWGMEREALAAFLEECVDVGVTTMDLADIYGRYAVEPLFGRVLALRPGLRERMQIATKCGIRMVAEARPEHRVDHYDTSRAHIVASVEASLVSLGTDRIDLLLIHRPDPLMDADEVAAAFDALRQAGKVLHFGVSNFAPSQLELLASRVPELVTNQVRISVLETSTLWDGTLDQCQRRRLAPMAWSPLGGGALFADGDERAARVRRALEEVGEQIGGAGPDQVALAWLLAHPARIVPVLGSGRGDRMRRATRAVDLELDRQQWFAILKASAGRDVP